MKLHNKILLGLVLGVTLGSISVLSGQTALVKALKPLGDIFIQLLKMVTIPLIMVSLMGAVAGFSDLGKLGRIGGKSLLLFAINTILAICTGIMVAKSIRPGARINADKKVALLAEVSKNSEWQAKLAADTADVPRSPGGVLLDLVPENPFAAMVKGDMLAVIFFSIMLGWGIANVKKERRVLLVHGLEALNESLVALVKFVMGLAPYAVCTLIAVAVTQFGFYFLIALLEYALVAIGTMLLFALVYYTLLISLAARCNPLHFFSCMRSVALLAFSTSSSNATLPENLIACEQRLGIPREIAAFVLPLGATINMSGTAIYQGVSVVFIAQVFGISLSIHQLLMVVCTATLAAVGTAGIPGVGIVTLAMVLRAADLPIEGIGLIIGVERILDMCRTVLNVLGDSAAALVVHCTCR